MAKRSWKGYRPVPRGRGGPQGGILGNMVPPSTGIVRPGQTRQARRETPGVSGGFAAAGSALLTGSAMITQDGTPSGLRITPSTAFDTAHSAATAVSANVWVFIPVGELEFRDWFIGRGRRAAGEGGWGKASHFEAGAAGNGQTWAELANTGLDMGSSLYAQHLTNDIVVEGAWFMLTLVNDLTETGNARSRVYSNKVQYDASSIVGAVPSDFSTMTNGDIEIGITGGFYDGDITRADGRQFREPAIWLRALTATEIGEMYDEYVAGQLPSLVDSADLYAPLGEDASEVNGMATALIGGATIAASTGTGAPFGA